MISLRRGRGPRQRGRMPAMPEARPAVAAHQASISCQVTMRFS
jgi:hypothetical protein